jgi:hypothetical protein
MAKVLLKNHPVDCLVTCTLFNDKLAEAGRGLLLFAHMQNNI